MVTLIEKIKLKVFNPSAVIQHNKKRVKALKMTRREIKSGLTSRIFVEVGPLGGVSNKEKILDKEVWDKSWKKLALDELRKVDKRIASNEKETALFRKKLRKLI